MQIQRQDLPARARALRAQRAPLDQVLASIGHLETIAHDNPSLAGIHAMDRLEAHFDVVVDCLEQTAAIETAGFEAEWAAGLASIRPVRLKTTGDLPIYVLRTADALQVKAFLLVALNRVRDYLDLDMLTKRSGHESAAAAIALIDQVFTNGESGRAPLATQLVRRLAKPTPRIGIRKSPGFTEPSAERWAESSETCSSLCAHVLLHNEPRAQTNRVRGTDEMSPAEGWSLPNMVQAIEQGDLVDWQHLAHEARVKPWGTVARTIPAAGDAADEVAVATALRGVVVFARGLRDRLEREEVARRVTKFVKVTGLTQKAIATRIGTSASRLSTYMNGSVTPSASMMIRIERQKAEVDSERKRGT